MENLKQYISKLVRITGGGRQVEEIKSGIKREWVSIFDAIHDWVCLIDLKATILRTNIAGEKFCHLPVKEMIGRTCCQLVHHSEKILEACPLHTMLRTGKRESVDVQRPDGRWLMVTVDPVFDTDGKMTKAVHIARDITQMVLIQNERKKLVKDYRAALIQVKTLKGLLPICSICKKIRDDKGNWNQIENYISTHTDASFTHSICPHCAREHYGEFEVSDKGNPPGGQGRI